MNTPNEKLEHKHEKITEQLTQAKLAINTETCFVGHTLVLMGDDDYKRIDEIQVGDMVMAMPEDGIGEPVAKRVVNTMQFENKAIWYLGVSDHGSQYSVSDFAVTPEHPFCVYGYAPDVHKHEDDNPITFYDAPQWKQVQELRVGDVVMNVDGMYYTVVCVKPFAKDYKDGIAWLQGGTFMQNWQGQSRGSLWNIAEPRGLGKMISEFETNEENDENIIETDTPLHTPLYDNQGATGLTATGTQYAPYTTTVYNIEVEDYHTYFVGHNFILVHNKNNRGC